MDFDPLLLSKPEGIPFASWLQSRSLTVDEGILRLNQLASN